MRLAGLVVNASKSHCRHANQIRNNARHQSTTHTPAPVRQAVTREERAARRAARKERANAIISSIGASEGAAVEGQIKSAAAASKQQRASASSPMFDATRVGWYAAVLIPTAAIGWGIVDDESPPAKLSRFVGLTAKIDEFSKPTRTKLLPDWNQIPNIPPDFPAPPTLVVDLENTLVSSTWDRKYGWRHAKRPGVDKFLATMSQYYEVVLFSPSPDGLAGPVVDSLDSSGYAIHRLFRESTNYHNGVHCKDLSWLNRNLNKVIALDDDPTALQFQPENLIQVKPYENPDVEDNTLARITPLLVEISREGYDDIPGLLSQFKGMDADEIADEFERRVGDLRARRDQIVRTGLGSFASSKGGLPPPELPPNLEGSGSGQAQNLTAKDIVGNAPPPVTSNSGVIGWLQQRQQRQEEENKEKFGLWNEVMAKKQAEKKKKVAASSSSH